MALYSPYVVELWKDRLISSTLGGLTVTSDPIQVGGNRVVLAATITQISGTTPSLTLSLDGSYDGVSWKDSGATAQVGNAFGYMTEVVKPSCDFPFVRVRAIVAGTSPSVLFDAYLAFSQQ